ncbi:hypothetical protein NFI00_000004 [Salmonella enterica]|nr:hypothetical protein [Salmonella enterica]
MNKQDVMEGIAERILLLTQISAWIIRASAHYPAPVGRRLEGLLKDCTGWITHLNQLAWAADLCWDTYIDSEGNPERAFKLADEFITSAGNELLKVVTVAHKTQRNYRAQFWLAIVLLTVGIAYAVIT